MIPNLNTDRAVAAIAAAVCDINPRLRPGRRAEWEMDIRGAFQVILAEVRETIRHQTGSSVVDRVRELEKRLGSMQQELAELHVELIAQSENARRRLDALEAKGEA